VPHRVSAGEAPSLLLFPGGRNRVRTCGPSLMGPGDAHDQLDRLGGQRGAAVGVDTQLAQVMPCLALVAAISFSARMADSRVATSSPRRSGCRCPGSCTGGSRSISLSTFRWAVQLGDVPGVHLIRPVRHQLGLDGGGVGGLPAVPGFRRLRAAPVGGHRSQIGALVQQRRPDFVRARSANRPVCGTSRIAVRSAVPSAAAGPAR
jgi:hypothetical protein